MVIFIENKRDLGEAKTTKVGGPGPRQTGADPSYSNYSFQCSVASVALFCLTGFSAALMAHSLLTHFTLTSLIGWSAAATIFLITFKETTQMLRQIGAQMDRKAQSEAQSKEANNRRFSANFAAYAGNTTELLTYLSMYTWSEEDLNPLCTKACENWPNESKRAHAKEFVRYTPESGRNNYIGLALNYKKNALVAQLLRATSSVNPHHLKGIKEIPLENFHFDVANRLAFLAVDHDDSEYLQKLHGHFKTNIDDSSILTRAVLKGAPNCTGYLLSKGSDPRKATYQRISLSKAAVNTGLNETTKLVFNSLEDPKEEVLYAAQRKKTEVALYLLKSREPNNDVFGAAAQFDANLLKQLLEKQKEIDLEGMTFEGGDTLVHRAAEGGNLEALCLLIETHGLSKDAQNESNKTPLEIAEMMKIEVDLSEYEKLPLLDRAPNATSQQLSDVINYLESSGS